MRPLFCQRLNKNFKIITNYERSTQNNTLHIFSGVRWSGNLVHDRNGSQRMTHADAFEIVLRMFLLCGLFTPLAACAGWRDVPKKKKTTRRTSGRSTGRKPLMSESSKPSARMKKTKARPLSSRNQIIYDQYKFGFDFPGFKMSSNIPL